MVDERGLGHIQRAATVFVLTLVFSACGDGLTGPVAPNRVHTPLTAGPVLARTIGCEGGSAAGFPCDGVDLVARVTAVDLRPGRPATHVNDIWGWTDPRTGMEYALVGRDDGLSIVDLSTPHAPRPLAFLASHTGSSISRDMKVYADHVYVVADNIAGHGMQILDLTRLRSLTAFTELGADARYARVSAVHNLAINEETGFAYAVGSQLGGDTCGGGLHMINLSNPTRPTFAGCHAVPGTGRLGSGYTHDVQCVLYRGPDAEHSGREICVGSNETAIVVSDVTDKANPRTLSTFGVRMLDISNPSSPVEWGFFDTVPGHDNNTWDGSWSTYPWFGSDIFVATSWDEGLFVLRLQP